MSNEKTYVIPAYNYDIVFEVIYDDNTKKTFDNKFDNINGLSIQDIIESFSEEIGIKKISMFLFKRNEIGGKKILLTKLDLLSDEVSRHNSINEELKIALVNEYRRIRYSQAKNRKSKIEHDNEGNIIVYKKDIFSSVNSLSTNEPESEDNQKLKAIKSFMEKYICKSSIKVDRAIHRLQRTRKPSQIINGVKVVIEQ